MLAEHVVSNTEGPFVTDFFWNITAIDKYTPTDVNEYSFKQFTDPEIKLQPRLKIS